MGLLETVAGWFSSAGNAIAGVANSAYKAVKGVFAFASGIFHDVGGAWDWMVNGLGWLGDNVIGGFARVLHLLEWLALHAIPEGLSWVYTKLYSWARAAIHAAEHALTVALDAVHRVLDTAIHALENWARSAVKWIEGLLLPLWHWVENTAKRAVDLVLHPERLVAWILADLVLPLVKWLIQQSAPIIVWMAKAARSVLPELAHTIEDALEKLV